jgi:glycosyltransferase involved in cell wall biosynthesis
MKVCFVCLDAYPLFRPSIGTLFGGSEVRAWLLATGLARNPSHDVSFVVFDHGQPRLERIGAVTVYPHSCHRHAARGGSRWPGVSKYVARVPRFPFVAIRRFEPAMLVELPVAAARWLWRSIANVLTGRAGPSLWLGRYEVRRDTTRIYEQIDADAYCVFGVSELAAQVAAYCAAFGKKIIVLANSDENFSPVDDPARSDVYYRAVMAADVFVTQTESQRQMLRDRFGCDCVTMRNPIELPAPRDADAPQPHDGRIALWIGRSEEVKQPLVLLALARAAPDIRFLMVLNRVDPELYDRIARQKPGNVQLLERVGYQEADRLFARAFVLINTSILEGFPNTFLQAGKHGVPILSLNVDPDGFIRERRCGFFAAGVVGRLTQGLRALRDERELWTTCSANVRHYVETCHGLDGRVRELDALLARALGLTA